MYNKNQFSRSIQKIYRYIFNINWRSFRLGLYDKGRIKSIRLKKFLQEHITTKFKNKLIILDNAKIKELVNKHNNLLYSVPY